ncbi:MAG TPA: ribosome biogenesis GTPase Der [Polyangia bacterium]|nr:ribosome biogenesis GTPase Der [Polyangia bacterium]
MSRRSRRPADDPSLPIVSLVGRPNVGKSSLFNRLVGGQPALVEDMPGVTRDRRYGVCDWVGARFRLTDTGGLDPGASGILGAMRSQTLRSVDEAAVLILVLDVKEGITPVDEEVAQLLRRTGKPVLVAANKVDSATREPSMAEVFRLGFDQVFAVSAAHGRGVGDLLDATVAALGGAASPALLVEKGDRTAAEHEAESSPIRLAFVGKPNVGKSSLVNRLLGEERVLVHDQPGTTRDPIDTPFAWQGREFVLVDTAGLRRRRAIDTLTEAVSAKMARDQLARADVVALVIDAQNGATAEDAKLASFIEESGRAALIVVNKGDLIRRAEIDGKVSAVREELGFMAWAPVVVTSAVTGRGTSEIPKMTAQVFGQWCRRVPTSELNNNFEELVARRPPPAGPGGSYVRLYYITQAQTSPPSFFVSANYPKAVGLPYRRYLTNQLRNIYGFAGSPLRLVLRAHKGKKPVRKAG